VTTTVTPASVGATVDSDISLKKKRKQAKKEYYGQKAKMGAIWSVIRQGGNELFHIPTSAILARLLSPTDFGIAAASSFFVTLAARLTQFGFNASLVRVKDLRPEHTRSVFAVNLAIGLVSYLVLFAASPFIGQFFRSPDAGRLVRFAALSFVISPFVSIPTALMQRNMQFRYRSIVDWTDTLVGNGTSIVLAFMGFGYWSLPSGNLAGMLISIVLQTYLCDWRPSLRFSREALRELLSFGLAIQAKRVFEYASQNIDNFMVGRVLGVTALGLYDKAFTTMNRLVFRMTLGQTYFRIFSVIHEDIERFQRAYTRLILTISLMGLPVFAGCIVVARPLFDVMYGRKWGAAVLPFQLLCAGGMLKLLNAYASQANEAAGGLWAQVRRQALGAVMILVGAGVGSQYGGVTGAAVGVLIAMVVLTVAMQALVRQVTHLTWWGLIAPQIPGATCAALLVGVLLATGAGLRVLIPHPPSWLLLITQMAAGGLFYAAFVLFSPFASVREIVTETLTDVLPPGRLQVLNWRRKQATNP
jgi:O-antigen/teichoic acid export membrane protein